jgi:NAD(P)H-flavin reductase
MDVLQQGLERSAQGPMVPAPYEIVGKRQDTEDVWTLELAARSGEPFPFGPGQFTMIAAGGAGEVPISISGDPDHPQRLVHTIRAVGLATRAICDAEPGDVLSVRGPFGTEWPVQAAEGSDVLIAAGGIGLPPLRPAIYHVLAHRESFDRLILLYGARTPSDLLFTGELAGWRSRFDLTVEVTVDTAGRDWHGTVGVVPDLIGKATFEPENTVAFTVGPEIMMRFTVRALLAAGVPEDRVFLSMERDMQCATALCGHCQLGPFLVCRDGPVFGYRPLARWLRVREL